ncbi:MULTISPECIES: hypothetical protein [unclassified Streptomyces]|uniref:hypothetical protein n=1 Tax=unclassified Streptomyces TaxID=2593676 RepID=UPI002E18B2D8
MSERDLRRRCRRLLNELEIRPPLDVEELCRRFAQQRGRDLQLLPFDIPVSGPYGLWIGHDVADYIVYQQQTSPAHQRHIILHEIGHILAGHENRTPLELPLGLGRGGPGSPNEPVPFPDESRILYALGRSAYDHADEREAETVATIILEWASVLDHVVAGVAAQTAAQRMDMALSDRLGWL